MDVARRELKIDQQPGSILIVDTAEGPVIVGKVQNVQAFIADAQAAAEAGAPLDRAILETASRHDVQVALSQAEIHDAEAVACRDPRKTALSRQQMMLAGFSALYAKPEHIPAAAEPSYPPGRFFDLSKADKSRQRSVGMDSGYRVDNPAPYQRPNEPCACGSGKKHKNCCRKQR